MQKIKKIGWKTDESNNWWTKRRRENNRKDLAFRRDDIHNIAELVGLLKTSDGNETAAATLSIKPREAANVDDSDNLVYDNTI